MLVVSHGQDDQLLPLRNKDILVFAQILHCFSKAHGFSLITALQFVVYQIVMSCLHTFVSQ